MTTDPYDALDAAQKVHKQARRKRLKLAAALGAAEDAERAAAEEVRRLLDVTQAKGSA
jgi:hypothetical protein